ncbi:hypothetical protein [Paraburkholderia antibiotica]|uniref:Uncharacterized protein n=1 Tax=Paraburkholderia antibiotica TaxID=2728839 RepID=A0A7X9X5V4_9BURK|nr:hypothetical protein [Paraburkholderia antibiotica]NML32011.1 hypothetical protein [Paraburkholderia antibiotica]
MMQSPIKRISICFALALVMTLPVGFGIARLGAYEWLDSDAGFRLLRPLFDAFDAHGCEGYSDVIVGTLLVVSFVLSLVFVVAGWAIVRRSRRKRRSTVESR